MNLEELYELFKNLQLIPDLESKEVIQTVEEYKDFWKPNSVKTILLAESHVFTCDDDFSVKIDDDFILRHIQQPRNFVRYVYCLGYGENSILMQPLNNNSGTWQYWKIFYACNDHIQSNDDFDPILIGGNPNLQNRINNKYKTLKSLKELGVWLIDTSLFALYTNDFDINLRLNYREVLKQCWKSYIREQILDANPKNIIIIGHNVYNALSDHLAELLENFNLYKFFQPQAHITAHMQLNQYQEYFRICHQD